MIRWVENLVTVCLVLVSSFLFCFLCVGVMMGLVIPIQFTRDNFFSNICPHWCILISIFSKQYFHQDSSQTCDNLTSLIARTREEEKVFLSEGGRKEMPHQSKYFTKVGGASGASQTRALMNICTRVWQLDHRPFF